MNLWIFVCVYVWIHICIITYTYIYIEIQLCIRITNWYKDLKWIFLIWFSSTLMYSYIYIYIHWNTNTYEDNELTWRFWSIFFNLILKGSHLRTTWESKKRKKKKKKKTLFWLYLHWYVSVMVTETYYCGYQLNIACYCHTVLKLLLLKI
jgi:hypothetical protein